MGGNRGATAACTQKPVAIGRNQRLPFARFEPLREAAPHSTPIDPDTLRETGRRIEAKLAEFGIDVQVVSAIAGPVITRYEIEPAKGVKGSQIVNLSKDLARSLSVQSVRVVETIVGKTTMGIELPNEQRQEVLLQEIFLVRRIQRCAVNSRWLWAKTLPACRWWVIWRKCRICWWAV